MDHVRTGLTLRSFKLTDRKKEEEPVPWVTQTMLHVSEIALALLKTLDFSLMEVCLSISSLRWLCHSPLYNEKSILANHVQEYR